MAQVSSNAGVYLHVIPVDVHVHVCSTSTCVYAAHVDVCSTCTCVYAAHVDVHVVRVHVCM